MMQRLFSLLFPVLILAQSQELSPIPLPSSQIILIDEEDCNVTCLQAYLDDGQVFTFLALSDNRLQDEEMMQVRQEYLSLFNLDVESEELKIAMLLPYKRIGRYAHSTSNAVFAYLLTRNQPFVFKNFALEDEEYETIQTTLAEIKEEGFTYIIAPLTKKGAENVASQERELQIFFPTINRQDVNTSADNLYFGAIDYKAQIQKLIPKASSPLVVLYGKSAKGRELYEETKETYLTAEGPFEPTARKAYAEEEKISYEEELEPLEPTKRRVIAYGIDSKQSSMKWHFENNEKIQFGSFFINTPVIKSTMILSQFSTYDTNTTNTLSTQLNYDPLLFSMTQSQDRKKMYIANSININNNILVEANVLLNNDINYNWINYTATVGIDLFYHFITRETRQYDLPIENSQIIYPISIVHPVGTRFETLDMQEDANLTLLPVEALPDSTY